MSYTRTQWINGYTRVNATTLNNIENGIEETKAALALDEVDLSTLSTSVNAHIGLEASISKVVTGYNYQIIECPSIALKPHTVYFKVSHSSPEHSQWAGHLWHHNLTGSALYTYTTTTMNVALSTQKSTYTSFKHIPTNASAPSWENLYTHGTSLSLTNGYITTTTPSTASQTLYLCFTSASDTSQVYLYAVDGLNNSIAGDGISFYLEASKGLLFICVESSNVTYKKTIYNVPTDFMFKNLCWSGTATGASYSIYACQQACATFRFADDQGRSLVSTTNIYAAGEYKYYYAPVLEPTDDYDPTSVLYARVAIPAGISAVYSINYMKDTEHLDILKHVPAVLSQTEIISLIQSNLSSGTADPDSLTPGLFYVKYLDE